MHSEKYKLIFANKARKYMSSLNKELYNTIFDEIEKLAENPKNPILDIKPLVNRKNEYRLRIGSYRVIYDLDKEVITICVLRIGTRGDVYKNRR